MSRKSLCSKQISEVLDSLANLEVDSEEELICDEDSEEKDNILPNEDDSSSSTYEEDSDEYDDEDYITSRNGTKWRKTSPSAQRKTLRRNTLRVASGLTAISKNIDTPISAFQLPFDDSIFNVIIDCSEKKAVQLGHPEWKLKRESLNAFIGILILFGATRGRKESIKCVWNDDGAFCRPIFKAIMGHYAFQNILRFIRADNHETCQERRTSDKLAPIREVWEIFTKNCQKCLVPESQMCVDKQLVGFRKRYPFRVYMKSKPDRYGIKIWDNCKNPSGYVWKSQVYTGQIFFAPEKKQGQRVVLDLVKALGQGYGVTCDNLFTSLKLAKELAKQNKTLLGTLRLIRKEVPKIMLPSKLQEVNSSLFLFSRDAMMVSYVLRKNKSVILLSSQHNDQAVSIAEHTKPDIILNYNKFKGAVDSADKMLKEFSCRRISKRWPFVLLTHIITVCSLNAYVLYQKKFPNTALTRLNFLKDLGSELVKPAIKRGQILQEQKYHGQSKPL